MKSSLPSGIPADPVAEARAILYIGHDESVLWAAHPDPKGYELEVTSRPVETDYLLYRPNRSFCGRHGVGGKSSHCFIHPDRPWILRSGGYIHNIKGGGENRREIHMERRPIRHHRPAHNSAQRRRRTDQNGATGNDLHRRDGAQTERELCRFYLPRRFQFGADINKE